MQDRLTALQKKPKHVRERYALLGAGLVTLCLLGIWVTTVPVRLAKLTVHEAVPVEPREESAVVPVQMPEAPGRYEHVAAAVVAAYHSLAAMVTTIVKDTEPSVPHATSTPMVWTERLEARETGGVVPDAEPVLISTSSAVASTSSRGPATTTPVIQ